MNSNSPEHRIELGASSGISPGFSGRLQRPGDPEIPIVIDASRLGFVCPMFMIRLRAYVDFCVKSDRTVEFICPQSLDVATYLSRMHIGTGLEDCFTDLPSITEHDRAGVLVPITQLAGDTDVDALAEDLYPLLTNHFQDVAVFTDAITMSIAELCGNGVDHGANPHGCLVAAQHFRRGGRTVLSIGDLGDGIPKKMRRAFDDLTSDEEALEKAIERGITSTGESSRGNGFHWVFETVGASRMQYFKMKIRSGNAALDKRVTAAGDHTVVSARASDRTYVGTWLDLTFGPA